MLRLPVLLAALALAVSLRGADAGAPQIDLREFQRQRIELLLEPASPALSAEQRARIGREFLAHVRRNARITAERLDRGEIDDEELRTRLKVFLEDRPELRGAAAAAGDAPSRVRAALARAAGAPADEAARRALAAAFLERLAQRGRTALEALSAGRMPESELDSRVTVFLADWREEHAVSAGEKNAAAALAAFAERFVAANFGTGADRVQSLALRGTADEGGRRREFVLFRQHPDRVRLHYVENGVVTLALGHDGEHAWRQEASGRAIYLSGAEARAVRELAEFDHPLIDSAARRVAVKLAGGTLAGPGAVELELERAGGAKTVSRIDAATLQENAVVRVAADGKRSETRLSDYRKLGAMNVPYRQETWEDGALKRTVVIAQAEIEPGLLAEFFARPDGGRFAFMDFMGALDVIRKKQAAAAPATGGGS